LIYCSINDVRYEIPSIDVLNVLDVSNEPWYRYLKLKENMVFIDVGAHIGKCSLYYAKRYPKGIIIALEPYPENFNAPVRGILRNKLHNVIPLKLATWKKNTMLKLYVHRDSALHSTKRASKRLLYVKAVTLDALVDTLIMKGYINGRLY